MYQLLGLILTFSLVSLCECMPARTSEQPLKHGQSSFFKDCEADCSEMVVIPAGSFPMGSPQVEPGHQLSEATWVGNVWECRGLLTRGLQWRTGDGSAWMTGVAATSPHQRSARLGWQTGLTAKRPISRDHPGTLFSRTNFQNIGLKRPAPSLDRAIATIQQDAPRAASSFPLARKSLRNHERSGRSTAATLPSRVGRCCQAGKRARITSVG
jgi:hypothetical protein